MGSPCSEPGVWGHGCPPGTFCASMHLKLGGREGCPVHQEGSVLACLPGGLLCRRGMQRCALPGKSMIPKATPSWGGVGGFLLGLFVQCLGFRKHIYWTWATMDPKMFGLGPQSVSPKLDRFQGLWEVLSAHMPCVMCTWCCRREALLSGAFLSLSFHKLQLLVAGGDGSPFTLLAWYLLCI